MSSGRTFQPIFFVRRISGVRHKVQLGQQDGLDHAAHDVRGGADAPAQPRPVGVGTATTATVAVERTVTGLGYELVEMERAPRGLLRVMIDRVPGHAYPEARGGGEFVTIDDCEAVTRQLQLTLEVEGVAYERLEVSSPGLDRPLRREADYARFAGQEIELALKEPFQGRRHWRGVLARRTEGWALELAPEAPPARSRNKDKVKVVAPVEAGATRELGFQLGEVREARLVPVIDFKGRARGPG